MSIQISFGCLLLAMLLYVRASAQEGISGLTKPSSNADKVHDFFAKLLLKGPNILFDKNPKRMTVESPNYRDGHTFCMCSPTGSNPSSAAVEKARKAIRDSAKFVIISPSRTWHMNCLNTSITDCINADASLRKKVQKPLCAYDAESGGNLYTYANESKRLDGLAVVQKCDVLSKRFGLPGEGCVAVEHLKGYRLQHRHHLMRAVLCGRGFCAIPNHAIIVQSRRTCMKELCSSGGWECITTRKLVNNLKIAANTRAVTGDITITPYDLRFPVAAIWAVQILEDVFSLITSACALAVATAMLLLLLSKMEC